MATDFIELLFELGAFLGSAPTWLAAQDANQVGKEAKAQAFSANKVGRNSGGL